MSVVSYFPTGLVDSASAHKAVSPGSSKNLTGYKMLLTPFYTHKHTLLDALLKRPLFPRTEKKLPLFGGK